MKKVKIAENAVNCSRKREKNALFAVICSEILRFSGKIVNLCR